MKYLQMFLGDIWNFVVFLGKSIGTTVWLASTMLAILFTMIVWGEQLLVYISPMIGLPPITSRIPAANDVYVMLYALFGFMTIVATLARERAQARSIGFLEAAWQISGFAALFPLGVFIAFGILLTMIPTVTFYADAIASEKTVLELWDAAPMLQSISIVVGTVTIAAIISCLIGIYVTCLKQRANLHE